MTEDSRKCHYCGKELASDGTAGYCANKDCIVYDMYVMYIDKKGK